MVPAVAVKLPMVEPAGILTEPGTFSKVELLDRVTAAPPVGAAPDSTTLQFEVEPLPRLNALQVNELITSGPSENTVAALVPL